VNRPHAPDHPDPSGKRRDYRISGSGLQRFGVFIKQGHGDMVVNSANGSEYTRIPAPFGDAL
jgi:hypothetical protein